MKKLKEYFALQKEVHDYFGYEEDYKVIPLESATDYYWILDENGGTVRFWSEPLTSKMLQDFAYYENVIYTQRFLPKYVYRGEKYTMISVDTRTDGNKFLQVFDNEKEQKVPE